jgi:hypothetical protein
MTITIWINNNNFTALFKGTVKMNFLRRLFSSKQSARPASELTGTWIHQESGGTFYHQIYLVGQQLHFDTLQITPAGKAGVTLTASEINWDGTTLTTTQVSPTGFRIHTRLRMSDVDYLKGTVQTAAGSPNEMVIRKLSPGLAAQEIAGLRARGIQIEIHE